MQGEKHWEEGERPWREGERHSEEGERSWKEGERHWEEGERHWVERERHWEKGERRWEENGSNRGRTWSRGVTVGCPVKISRAPTLRVTMGRPSCSIFCCTADGLPSDPTNGPPCPNSCTPREKHTYYYFFNFKLFFVFSAGLHYASKDKDYALALPCSRPLPADIFQVSCHWWL